MQHWKSWRTVMILSFLWTASGSADDTIVLQLRWDHQFQFAGYYAANWQGYYTDEGLDVEIRSALTDEGDILSAVEEVVSGRADFGIGAADILKVHDQGPPLSVVATIFQQSAAAFYLKQDTPFRSLADLARLRVARRVNDLIDIELQAMLLNEGIDPADVPPHEHQPGLDHLLSDRIQVMPGYRTSTPYHTDEHGKPFREILPADYGVDFYGDSLFTRTTLTQHNPELVEKFRRASLKGWQYALDHPEELVVKISNDLPRHAKLKDLEGFNRFQMQVVKELILYPIIAIGNSTPERWLRMHAFLKQLGQVERELNLSTFIFDPERLRFKKQQRFKNMMLWSTIVVTTLLMISALWTLSLKRQVAQKTRTLQQEIAGRQKIQEALATSERTLTTLMENLPGMAYRCHNDRNWTMEFVSKGCFALTGYSSADLLQNRTQSYGQLIHAADRDDVWNGIQQTLQEKRSFQLIYRIITAQQEEKWVWEQGVGVKAAEDGPTLLEGFITDITAYKQAEDALRTSERLLRTIAENYPSYLSIIEADLTVGFTSGREFTKLGLNPDDFVGLTLEQVFREQTDLVRSYYQQAFSGQEVNFELYINDQYQRYTALPLYDEDGNILRILAVVENITERKQAEQALQKSEERFTLAMQATNDGLYDWNLVTNEIYFSPGWKRMLGYTDDELENDFSVWERLTDPDGVKKSWEMLQELLDHKRDRFEVEFTMQHKDGHWVDILSRANAVFDEQGKGVRVVGTHVDISERKRVEKELYHLNQTLEAAQKMAKVGYWSYEIATQMPSWSDQMFVVCGYDPASGVPSYANHKKTWHPDDWEMFDAAVQACIKGTPYNIVIRIIFPDGSIHYVNTQGFPRYNERNEITELFGTSQDITELKQAEQALHEYSERLEAMVEERSRKLQEAQEKLLRHEKLAALGQLAGSVAHELRHPLGVLSNAAYFLKISLTDADDTTGEYLEMITAEVRKSDKIISDLLDFSRNQLTEKHFSTAIQLRGLVDEVLVEHPPPEGVELESEFENDLPPVLGDPQQIKQVVTNLLLNAYQSMPEGGTLTVGSRQKTVGGQQSAEGSEQSNRDSSLPTADSLLLTIKDTGCGIAPEHLGKLFEPLFTTKSKGIGLGLAISKNLIEANGGRIEVASEPGTGSTFNIILPAESS